MKSVILFREGGRSLTTKGLYIGITIIRWVVVFFALVGMWAGITWVVYLIITLYMVGRELERLFVNLRDRGSIFGLED